MTGVRAAWARPGGAGGNDAPGVRVVNLKPEVPLSVNEQVYGFRANHRAGIERLRAQHGSASAAGATRGRLGSGPGTSPSQAVYVQNLTAAAAAGPEPVPKPR